MTPRAYYNDIDPYCCKVLRKQIAAGNLPPGDVDERSITDIDPAELRGYTQIHLFAGIGGIPYGLRLAGVPDELNIITGGFPCQDISNAGQRAGITGARSGLWSTYAALICALRPRYVLVENVAVLVNRGLSTVLGDLAACGYDAEWDCIPASAVGAPHRRDRLWIVAYPNRTEWRAQPEGRNDADGHDTGRPETTGGLATYGAYGGARSMADAKKQRCYPGRLPIGATQEITSIGEHGQNVADPDFQGLEIGTIFGGHTAAQLQAAQRSSHTGSGQWAIEPAVGRVAHGVSGRVGRLRGLGNAVVPQVVEVIGHAIKRHAEASQ